MDSANKFRRSAFVNPVWAQVQSGGFAVVLSKLASLAILAGLLVAAWVAVSFVRTGLAVSDETEQAPQAPPVRAPEGASNTVAPKREPIVYVAESDSTHYHQCGHAPTDGPRQAIPASLARSRGLEPCSVCFRK
jgi:hypothetical protein